MTPSEYRQEFDILYNNVMSNAAPGLDEYDISVISTKALYEILSAHFNPKGNKYSEGFDNSPKRQMDFKPLIITKSYSGVSSAFTQQAPNDYEKIDRRSYVGDIRNEDIYTVLSESARLADYTEDKFGPEVNVMPIDIMMYNNLMTKPYKYPLKNSAWRILNNGGYAEIVIAPYESMNKLEYTVTYIKRPYPIIVADLTSLSVTVEGKAVPYSVSAVSELGEVLQKEVLQRAVEIAKSAYIGDISSAVQLGNRSE